MGLGIIRGKQRYFAAGLLILMSGLSGAAEPGPFVKSVENGHSDSCPGFVSWMLGLDCFSVYLDFSSLDKEDAAVAESLVKVFESIENCVYKKKDSGKAFHLYLVDSHRCKNAFLINYKALALERDASTDGSHSPFKNPCFGQHGLPFNNVRYFYFEKVASGKTKVWGKNTGKHKTTVWGEYDSFQEFLNKNGVCAKKWNLSIPEKNDPTKARVDDGQKIKTVPKETSPNGSGKSHSKTIH